MDFISGEKLQNIADLYLGNGENFVCNPFIMAQTDKHQLLDDITGPFDNPAILFLYPHIIDLFVPKDRICALFIPRCGRCPLDWQMRCGNTETRNIIENNTRVKHATFISISIYKQIR